MRTGAGLAGGRGVAGLPRDELQSTVGHQLADLLRHVQGEVTELQLRLIGQTLVKETVRQSNLHRTIWLLQL